MLIKIALEFSAWPLIGNNGTKYLILEIKAEISMHTYSTVYGLPAVYIRFIGKISAAAAFPLIAEISKGS